MLNYLTKTSIIKGFIYLVSFPFLVLLNHLLVNSINYPMRGRIFINLSRQVIPCDKSARLFYIIAFLALKTFVYLFLRWIERRKPHSYMSELLIAFFLYDLIYILFGIMNVMGFKRYLFLFISSPQLLLRDYYFAMDIIVSAIWIVLLTVFLKQNHYLTSRFIPSRIALMILSIMSSIFIWNHLILPILRSFNLH
jgi:hypothetical protein